MKVEVHNIIDTIVKQACGVGMELYNYRYNQGTTVHHCVCVVSDDNVMLI